MTVSLAAFASALGASTDPDVYATALPSTKDLQTINTFLDQDSPTYRTDMHKLANGYLPSFLRRLYRTPFDIYGERLHLFLKVFVVIVVLPDFARFVREHTKEAQEFWLVHVERVSTFPLEFFESVIQRTCPTDLSPTHLLRQLLSLHRLFSAFSLHSPPTLDPLPIPQQTYQRLIRLGPNIIRVRNTMTKEAFSPMSEAFDCLIRLVSDWPETKKEKERQVEDGQRHCQSWIHCDGLKAGEKEMWEQLERGGKAGPCKEEGEGEEMLACGRCQLVRYCSREHQRIRWKEHKPECFPPVW